MLPRLETLRAVAWRQAARISDYRLGLTTWRALGMAPGCAVERYRIDTAEWLRSLGYIQREFAEPSGYSDGTTVSRALRRRWRREDTEM